ncbi:nucleobase-ascorbate transporter 6-like [Hevea brasiliensis]|uniref:nucleobase-ascorbate transporter 6-like n=1 Tax=Hevea brasiliensis TaxID=3981 RepID=UPI0025E3A0DC|nr:nucleobase-ascorbate transporter 6-like [Hevea brasiliensis]
MAALIASIRHHFTCSSPPQHIPNCSFFHDHDVLTFPCSSTCQHKCPSPPPPVETEEKIKEKPSLKVRKRTKEEIIKETTKENREKQPTVKSRLPEIDEEDPSWSDLSLYITALQHSLVITWTSMISPYMLAAVMGGGNVGKAEAIQSSLFTAAISTILQYKWGSQFPVMMKTSDSFISTAISIAISTNNKYSATLLPRQRFKLSMRRIQGASIIASLLQIIIGFSGATVLFASRIAIVASIPLVTVTGVGLYQRGFPQLKKCIEIGLPAIFIVIFSTQVFSRFWKSENSIARRFAVTLSVAFIWTISEIVTASGTFDNASQEKQANCRTDRSGLIAAAPWINIQLIHPFQWGNPTFEVRDAFLMMVASIVATIESIATFSAAARHSKDVRASPPTPDHSTAKKCDHENSYRSKGLESALPIVPFVLRNAIGFQGIGTFIDAVFGMGLGSIASTLFLARHRDVANVPFSKRLEAFTSPLSNWLSSTSKKLKLNVARILVSRSNLKFIHKIMAMKIGSIKYHITLIETVQQGIPHDHITSLTGKLAVILASIPLPIVAVLYIVFFPYVVSTGLEDINYCDLNRFRPRFILGFALFAGVSINNHDSAYDVFSGQPLPNNSSWFNDLLQVIASSPPTIASVLAIIFDVLMAKPSIEEGKKAEEPPKKPDKEPKMDAVEVVQLRPLADDLKSLIDKNHSAGSLFAKLFSQKH